MVSGKDGLCDAGNAVTVHACQKHTGFHLGRSNRRIVVNGFQRVSGNPKGNAVVSFYAGDVGSHGKKGSHNPFHRAALDGVVSGQFGYKILSCKDTGNQAGCGAAVSYI